MAVDNELQAPLPADFAAVQAAFNAWSAESGRDLNALSRVLALSTGPSYDPTMTRPPRRS